MLTSLRGVAGRAVRAILRKQGLVAVPAATVGSERDDGRRELSAARTLLRRRTAALRSLGYAYRGLRATIEGVSADELGPVSLKPISKQEDFAHRRTAALARARGPVSTAIARGEGLDGALVGAARALIDAGDHTFARALGQSLQRDPRTADVGLVIGAITAHRRGYDQMARELFARASRKAVHEHALAEYAFCCAHTDRSALENLVDEVVGTLDSTAPGDALAVVEACVGADLADAARRLVGALAGSVDDPRWAAERARLERLTGWVARMGGAFEASAADDVLRFGVIDYRQPDYAQSSSNIGDYVQSLAAAAHLVRHQGLRFTGPGGLGELFTELAGRVRPELQQAGPTRDVELVPINRDASSFDVIPRDTWLVAFGWYMHSIFGLRHDFPFHSNVNPIFISFHCNRLEMLTDDAISYLRAHAPIGCRDWTTVDLLLSAGVPAFFSGCLTTTTGALFPDPAPPEDARVAYVDTDAPEGEATINQVYPEVRDRSLVVNLREAVRQLDEYRTEYSRVVTSRLHCYLPCWSLGLDVAFRAKNPADARFHGLIDANEGERVEMRARITRLLDAVIAAVLEGHSREEVYALWRKICEPEVARARARIEAIPSVDPLGFDLDDAVAHVLSKAVHIPAARPREGEPVHVALALDRNLIEQIRVVAAGLIDNTARPLHLHVLCREHTRDDMLAFSALFDEVDVTWLPCDEIDYGPIAGMLNHITVSTMDRLLLPYLLPGLDRVVYHDIDALTVHDVGELYDLDLGESPLAARSAIARHVRSGHRNVRSAARRLREQPERAVDLLRRVSARVPFDFVAFNAGIMLLNLRRMRADDFGREMLPYVQMYGLNDQELLNVYAAHDRLVLDPSWNSIPTQEVVQAPRTIHWAGAQKPWADLYVEGKETWQEYERRVAERRARLGVAGER